MKPATRMFECNRATGAAGKNVVHNIVALPWYRPPLCKGSHAMGDFEHPSFPRPPGATKIWRYMDWQPKFTGLVEERRLWMSWLSMLEDKYEGKTPAIITEELALALAGAEDDAERAAISDNVTILRRFAETFYPNYFVSCWCVRDVESDLMWRAYTSTSEAVVVQTTVDRLARALPDYLYIGLVRYIDYRRQGFGRMNMLEWPMHKRLEYVDDRELRVLADAGLWDQVGGNRLRENLLEGGDGDTYMRVCAPPVDLTHLIEAIHLHPRADRDFATRATAFCKDNALPEPRSSELANGGSF